MNVVKLVLGLPKQPEVAFLVQSNVLWVLFCFIQNDISSLKEEIDHPFRIIDWPFNFTWIHHPLLYTKELLLFIFITFSGIFFWVLRMPVIFYLFVVRFTVYFVDGFGYKDIIAGLISPLHWYISFFGYSRRLSISHD